MTIKYTPQSFFLYGWAIVLVLLAVGPYTYKIYSVEGLVYLAFCCLIFFVGLYSSKIKDASTNVNSITMIHSTKQSESLILLFELIVLISFIIYINFLSSITGGNLNFASEDIRHLITDRRTMLSRIAEVGLHAAAPCYLIIRNSSKTYFKHTNFIASVFFWLPPIAYLYMSARWNFFIYLIIFLVDAGIKKKSKKKAKKKLTIKVLIIYFLIAFMLLTVFNLFESRGIYNADSLYLIYPGDIRIRNWALDLYNITNGFVNPIYKGLNYFTHGITVFSYFYENYVPESYTLGLYQFQFIEYLLMLFNINFIEVNEVLKTVAGHGLYKTFLLGFVIDWGFNVAPIAVFLNGVFFGRIYKSRNKRLFSKIFYPIMLTMCLISPIYFFWAAAGLTMDLFMILLLIPLLKMSGAKLHTQEGIGNSM